MEYLYGLFCFLIGIAVWEVFKYISYEIATRKVRKDAEAYWEGQVREVVGPDAEVSVTIGNADDPEEHWRPGEYRTITHYHDNQNRPVRKTVEVRRTDDYIPGEE